MYVSNTTNAHSALTSQPVYPYVLCCDFGGGNTTCNGNDEILAIYSATNAHAESPTLVSPNYYNDVCYTNLQNARRIDAGSATCNTLNNETAVIYISNVTNAHVESTGLTQQNYGSIICATVNLSATIPGNPCQITSASWSTTSTTENQQVSLNVATQDCQPGTQIAFQVFKSSGDTPCTSINGCTNPQDMATDSNGNAVGTWKAYPSDTSTYYFVASLVANSSINKKSSNNLLVSQPPDWCTTPPPGVVKCGDYLTEANCTSDQCSVANANNNCYAPNGISCYCSWNASAPTENKCQETWTGGPGLPDLKSQIDSFSCPLVGQSVTFPGTITNNGYGDASTFDAGFTLDGNSAGTQTISSLTAGSSTSVTSSSWTSVSAGQHQLGLCADTGNSINEVTKQNNCANESFYSGAGSCFTVSLTPSTDSGAAPLNGVDLTAQVTGVGLGQITYSFDCNNDGTPEATYTGPETTKIENGLCNYASAGVYIANVTVTSNGMTAWAAVPITVTGSSGGTPDLISNVNEFSPPITGQSIAFPGTVKNIGDGTATSSTAGFTLDTSSIGNPPVGSLTAGSSQIVNSNQWTAVTGNHLLVLCADTGNTVTEQDETNNCANSSFFSGVNGAMAVFITPSVYKGVAPLNGVDLTATVKGTGLGSIDYSFYCNNGEASPDATYTGTETTKTENGLCNYASAGVYIANVTASSNGMTVWASVPITVKQSVSGSTSNVGTCYYTASSSGTCQGNEFLTVDLKARWACVTNSTGQCVPDPQGLAASCIDKTETLQCPTQIPLPFFNFYNMVAAILVIAAVYLAAGIMRKKKIRILLK